MKKAITILILGVMVCLTNMTCAQYTFEMTNGRMLEVFSYNDSDFVDIKFRFNKMSMKNEKIRLYNEGLRFHLARERGDDLSKQELDRLVEKNSRELKEPKVKEAFIERSEIFAIHGPEGSKSIRYEYAPEIGNYYTVPEMQEYVIGQRDATLRFRSRRAFWGGVAFGTVGGFAWQNSIFTVTTPLIWTAIVALPNIQIRPQFMSDPQMRTEPYKAGFTKVARTRNMLKGLQGGLIGTIAGALIFAVVANNSPHIN